jgi:DNA-binding response OmpR family regulator
VVKPFSMRELVARVKTVLRRSSTGPASDADLEVGRLRLVPSRHEAFWDHECLELTSLEFDLLHTLMIHENHVLTRSQLLDQVWGYEYHGDLRVVDTAVKRLRARLRAMDPGAVETIVTIRGVGYKLVQG